MKTYFHTLKIGRTHGVVKLVARNLHNARGLMRDMYGPQSGVTYTADEFDLQRQHFVVFHTLKRAENGLDILIAKGEVQ